jgi:hypothetical protein
MLPVRVLVLLGIQLINLYETANAFNASATIFESLSDIDSKYVKLVDKEYDGISAEVKKWFKKLAVSTSCFTSIVVLFLSASAARKRRRDTTNG